MNELEKRQFTNTGRVEDDKVTLQEYSNILNVDESTIRKIIKVLFPDLLQNGKTTYLNELQCTAIKNKIGTGRNDLGNISEVKNIRTEIDRKKIVQQAYQILEEDVQDLQNKINDLEKEKQFNIPKVEFFDSVADSKDCLEMGTVAKMFGWGRNILFELLRDRYILRLNNEPYQEYMKYFRVIEQNYIDNEGEVHIKTKTLVKQIGVEFIRKLLTNKELKTILKQI